jgi:hypothetical protein
MLRAYRLCMTTTTTETMMLEEKLKANQARRIEVMSKAVHSKKGSTRWLALKAECERLSKEADGLMSLLKSQKT